MGNKTKQALQKLLLGVLTFGMVFTLVPQNSMTAHAASKNIINNWDFSSSDMGSWSVQADPSLLSSATSDTPIYGTVSTYGVISGRTSPFECFAQDITPYIENGKEYEWSFYACLSSDYEGAPADQRTVAFAPYVTVGGNTSYLGSYSGELKGTVEQVLEPGKWTKFEGTFTPAYGAPIEQIVIRLLEQGTNYGSGVCTLGSYYATGVVIREKEATPIILEDVPRLTDAIEGVLGKDTIVGCSITDNDITNKKLMALVRKHFNAVTLGNDLKPDSLLGYSWVNQYPAKDLQTVTLNGEKIVVPTLNYANPEKYLDMFLQWNAEDPEHPIKVRGHVLVWHSQTPEWFFHEDYDASKPDVSKEVMDKRLEWYIKTVMEHFTGPDSKYKGLFYGWDVVNEAVSDSGIKYRNDKENSSWWRIYQSEEFIINAFRYANKYADPNVELYYNDYNECNNGKKSGILNLLTAVKEAEGTRIDGMGMQGHYGIDSPSTTNFDSAVRLYAGVVDKIQITEWDINVGNAYNGTDESFEKITRDVANKYANIYKKIQLLQLEGINITGLTWWGTTDNLSWLQSRNSVGGASDGNSKQFPLLFDDNYEAKPSYWVFVDTDKYKELTAIQTSNPEDTKTDTKVETDDKADTNVNTDTKTDAETNTDADVDTNADASTDADTAVNADANADATGSSDAATAGSGILSTVLIVVGVILVALGLFIIFKNVKKKSNSKN